MYTSAVFKIKITDFSCLFISWSVVDMTFLEVVYYYVILLRYVDFITSLIRVISNVFFFLSNNRKFFSVRLSSILQSALPNAFVPSEHNSSYFPWALTSCMLLLSDVSVYLSRSDTLLPLSFSFRALNFFQSQMLNSAFRTQDLP